MDDSFANFKESLIQFTSANEAGYAINKQVTKAIADK